MKVYKSLSMYRIILPFFLIASTVAAQSAQTLVMSRKNTPAVFLNDSTIISSRMMNELQPQNIKTMVIHKDKVSTQQTSFSVSSPFGPYGRINVVSDENIATRTQPEIRAFLQMPNDTPVYVDGYLLQDPKLTVAANAMVEIEIIPVRSENHNEQPLINIWTLEKEMRLGFSPQIISKIK